LTKRQYLHATTPSTITTTITATSIATTTKAKGIKRKISRNVQGEVEPNSNTLCASRLPKGCISNIGTV
jgi:hypothetical protein